MKTIMTLLSITLLLFTVVGCGDKKTETKKEAINKSGAVDWSKMPRRYKKD